MRSVQVPDAVSGSGLLSSVATNLRLVHWNDGVIACLNDLRRIVERHQQVDVSAILEDI